MTVDAMSATVSDVSLRVMRRTRTDSSRRMPLALRAAALESTRNCRRDQRCAVRVRAQRANAHGSLRGPNTKDTKDTKENQRVFIFVSFVSFVSKRSAVRRM